MQGRSQTFGRGGGGGKEGAIENIVLNFEKNLQNKLKICNKFTIKFKKYSIKL